MSFILALNVQSYKSTRLEDDLATAAVDVATLSMLLAVVAVAYAGSASWPLLMAAPVGVAIWAIDHYIRVRIEWRYRRELRR